jgi:curli biogenesis system outer membrane secretion channel CsgG
LKKVLYLKAIFFIIVTIFLQGCINNINYDTKIVNLEKAKQITKKDKYILKRKVAIARFGNEAQYGKSALFGLNTNYNAQIQATDILSAKLASTEKFLLLDNSKYLDQNKSMDIDADYMIIGSVTEFGRRNFSEIGLITRVKTQVAYAKVSVRVIDVKTKEVIFAQEGSGESKTEASKLYTLGSEMSYDSSLNDKAISSAISAVVDGIINKMLDNPWRSYILSNDTDIIIAGAKTQGVRIGDTFGIYTKGKSIKNPQTGIPIQLPGKKIATIKVASQFGNSYTNEGSICTLIDGDISKYNIKDLYVQK